MKKANWIFLLLFILVVTSAFAWPWDKKDEVAVEETEVVVVEPEEPESIKDRQAADILLEDYGLEKKEMTQEEKEALQAKMINLTELAKTPVKYPKPVKVAEPVVTAKPARSAVAPRAKIVLPKVATQAAFPTGASPKTTVTPHVIKSELNQVIQYNKKMKAELSRQMDMLNQNLRMAKTYNKILNNMYPVSTGRNIADQAVDQEKIRIIHDEVKRMASFRAPPALDVKDMQVNVHQAKMTAEEAKRSSVLPIGKNAPKA